MPAARRKIDDNKKHSERGRWLATRQASPAGIACGICYVTCRICKKEQGPYQSFAQAGKDGVCRTCRHWGLHHRARRSG